MGVPAGGYAPIPVTVPPSPTTTTVSGIEYFVEPESADCRRIARYAGHRYDVAHGWRAIVAVLAALEDR